MTGQIERDQELREMELNSQTTLQSVIMRREPRILNDLEQHCREKNKSASTGKILEEGTRSSITVPLFLENRCVGFFFVSSRNKNACNRNHAFFARKIAYSIKQHIYYTFVLQLFNSGAYEIRPRFIREILWFAPLHDIGKIGIPDSILLKPGPLSPDEWAVMETHVSIGEEVLRSMDRGIRKTTNSSHLLTAIDITGSHHEKWDGRAYPRGLQGESIPLAGRIVALWLRPLKRPFPSS